MSKKKHEEKTTLCVSRNVSMAVKGAAALARLSLYEYTNRALAYAVKNMLVTIKTEGKGPCKH